jgi:uncharacterized C2H2 Zn-finger protein
MTLTVAGRYSGLPVTVHNVLHDGEEYQCPQCRRRFCTESEVVAHVGKDHIWLLKGENPQ